MKKKTILLSILAVIVIVLTIDIYNVNTKQNELLNIIENKKAEISILRKNGDIDRRYPAIAQLNEVIGDYNICVKIFPNTLYNKVILDKKPTDYLIK